MVLNCKQKIHSATNRNNQIKENEEITLLQNNQFP